MAVSLSKIREETGGNESFVSLAKTAGVSLSKHTSLVGHTAKCALVLDYSGSMRNRYANGEVQELAERALALATRFDDDGAIDVFLFADWADYAGELKLSDFHGGVDRLIRGRHMGTTSYSAAIRQVLGFYGYGQAAGSQSMIVERRGLFGRKTQVVSAPAAAVPSGPAELPVYVMFQTDGEPDMHDERPAELAIREASKYPVFWQFMGLGHNFAFLEGLDEMTGRLVDNAGFFGVPDIRSMSEGQLYDNMLKEYPKWVEEAKRLGLIL